MSDQHFPENQPQDKAVGYDEALPHTKDTARAAGNNRNSENRMTGKETASFFRADIAAMQPTEAIAEPAMFRLNTETGATGPASEATVSPVHLEGAAPAPVSEAATEQSFFGDVPVNKREVAEPNMHVLPIQPSAEVGTLFDDSLDEIMPDVKKAA